MKRWVLPILAALAVHLALFHATPAWNPPQIQIPENQTVTLSLAQLAPSPVQSPPVKPASRPVAKPAPKPDQWPVIKKLVPRPLPDPGALPDPMAYTPPRADPDPAIADPVKNESASAPSQKTSELPLADPGPDQAKVQASVPLYHLNPAPAYPAIARRRNFQGTVLLDVLVDSNGRAIQVKIAQSSGYAILDRSARNSVRLWRFAPARRFGQPIEMWVQVPVRFELQ